MKELHKIRWPMKDFNVADMVLCFNDCIEAIQELQALAKKARYTPPKEYSGLIPDFNKEMWDIHDKYLRDHAAKVMPEVWGEPRYTLAELREKWESSPLYSYDTVDQVEKYLDWMEEDSKKGD